MPLPTMQTVARDGDECAVKSGSERRQIRTVNVDARGGRMLLLLLLLL